MNLGQEISKVKKHKMFFPFNCEVGNKDEKQTNCNCLASYIVSKHIAKVFSKNELI